MYINVAETYGIWTIPTTVSQRPSPRPGRTGPGGHFLAKKGQKMPKKGGERTGESFCSGLIKGFLPENGHFWAIFRGPDPHFRAYPGWGGLPPLFRGCMGDFHPSGPAGDQVSGSWGGLRGKTEVPSIIGKFHVFID